MAAARALAIALVWAKQRRRELFHVRQQAAHLLSNEIGMAFFFALATQEIVEAGHVWRRPAHVVSLGSGGCRGDRPDCRVGWWSIGPTSPFGTQAVLTTAWPIACAIDVAAVYYLFRLCRAVPLFPLHWSSGSPPDAFGIFVVAPLNLMFALSPQPCGSPVLAGYLGSPACCV